MRKKSKPRKHREQARKKGKGKAHLESTAAFKDLPQAFEKVLVSDVRVFGKHRDLDREKVKAIAASMEEWGLRTPIWVRRTKNTLGATVLALVAGRHRLEAAKTRGRKYINAYIVDADKTDARVLQLIENGIRAELTPLQYAEDMTELAQIVLDSAKGGQLAHPGGKQPHDLGISRAAKALGLTRDKVRRLGKIARISEEAKEKAKEEGLDKKQSKLLQIAKETVAKAQLAKIKEIAKRKSAPKAKVVGGSKKAPPKRVSSISPLSAQDSEALAMLMRLWKKALTLKGSFARASPLVRNRFVKKIQCVDDDEGDSELSEQQVQQEDDELEDEQDDANQEDDWD